MANKGRVSNERHRSCVQSAMCKDEHAVHTRTIGKIITIIAPDGVWVREFDKYIFITYGVSQVYIQVEADGGKSRAKSRARESSRPVAFCLSPR